MNINGYFGLFVSGIHFSAEHRHLLVTGLQGRLLRNQVNEGVVRLVNIYSHLLLDD